MRYDNWRKGIFCSRPNRFIAHVELDGEMVVCHVKNTGRCKELLLPGATVYLEEHDSPKRKTKYSLVAVEKGEILINLDSQAPNKAVEEWLPNSGLFRHLTQLRREVTYGSSRFDFYVESDGKKCFLEVKGVTLEENGVVLFPDAPTERGVKHLRELLRCVGEGYDAYVLFVVQMRPVRYFTPNRERDPAFAKALKEAFDGGVKVLAVDCAVTPDTMEIREFVPVQLDGKER
ncbi:MAG: DNA/RNA nuclease SfsA [Oscillospiraceae bacterium]|nr:DNA/RNA nuclease SfsA [Oscillospiraceae bacterium]